MERQWPVGLPFAHRPQNLFRRTPNVRTSGTKRTIAHRTRISPSSTQISPRMQLAAKTQLAASARIPAARAVPRLPSVRRSVRVAATAAGRDEVRPWDSGSARVRKRRLGAQRRGPWGLSGRCLGPSVKMPANVGGAADGGTRLGWARGRRARSPRRRSRGAAHGARPGTVARSVRRRACALAASCFVPAWPHRDAALPVPTCRSPSCWPCLRPLAPSLPRATPRPRPRSRSWRAPTAGAYHAC